MTTPSAKAIPTLLQLVLRQLMLQVRIKPGMWVALPWPFAYAVKRGSECGMRPAVPVKT